ncbi:hypothetical protein ACFFWD_10405 [Bradyrhizobium erythrophlei]|uniref:hypothetical protein n=1 Tax=Bradyrhizobium erythrophlei TaxID=1437360 RepID=UPI0035F0D118
MTKLPLEKLERLIRTQVTLATKLRLAPQSRAHKETVGRWAANPQSSYLAQFHADEEEGEANGGAH